jgi:rare lipoprotein A
VLDKVEIMKEVLDSQVLISIPVAKSHSTTGVSMGIKGLMGLIWDRGSFHGRYNINQALADLATVLRPHLTVLDATRALTTGGPGGPGDVVRPNLVVAGIDPVAVDSYGVTVASWYGQQFHNHRTSDGEIFDQFAPSAAHKTLPLPCIVEVTNLANGRKMRLRVNDRGPFVDDRLIDLSRAAADQLGFEGRGTTRVRVRYISPAPPLAAGVMQASLAPRRQVLEPIRSHVADPTMPTREAAADDLPQGTQSPASAYNVQVGAFATRENAERVVAQLGDSGAGVVQPVQRGGDTLYRVVLGGFDDADTASAAQARASAAGFSGAHVIKPY